MPKDYHKGVKLQVYIPEALNNKINKCIEKLNNEYINSDYEIEPETRSSFIRKCLEIYVDRFDV